MQPHCRSTNNRHFRFECGTVQSVFCGIWCFDCNFEMGSYERDQGRLQRLLEEVSDMSEDDPYENKSEGDPEYELESSSSGSSTAIPAKRPRRSNKSRYLYQLRCNHFYETIFQF